jgi:glycerophosphoryl diester phosphodiesterase
MPAFERAVQMGADGIELDVQLSRDGVAVVLHDETVQRVWRGRGAVGSFTYAELRTLRADTDPGNAGLYIPTLEEVLAFVAQTGLWLNIELKTHIEPYPGIEEKVTALVEASGMRERVLYSSFNHLSLKKLLSVDPNAKTGILYSGILVDPWEYAKSIGAYAIHPAKNSLRVPGLMHNCHENGIEVNVWTIDEVELMKLCIRWGADGIITNTPDVALKQF